MQSVPPAATRRTAFGLAFVALSTLMYEILLTRIFSVTMWYHFAFVAISIAMFGMTVGALVVYLRPAWFPADRRSASWRGCVLFPIVIVLSFLTQLSIPFRVHPSIVAVYAIVLTYTVITVPFVAQRHRRRLVLTRFPRDVGRLYAADLVGAALGCVLLVWVLEITDGPTAVLASARSPRWRRSPSRSTRASRAAGAAASARASASAAGRRRRRPHRARVARLPGAAHSLRQGRLRSAAALRALEFVFARPRERQPERAREPYAWGLSTIYPADRRVQQLHLDIDVAAGTVITKAPAIRRRSSTSSTTSPTSATTSGPTGDALVVGIGGGRDMLSALRFGATSVTGVEINTQHPRHASTAASATSPAISIAIRACASSTTRRAASSRGSDDRYDMIQISLIDTWAATAAGAFVLSENSLYTVDAWRALSRTSRPIAACSACRAGTSASGPARSTA